MWSGCAALDKLDKNTSEWHNTVHDEYGGVGAPVGLTVFKTAGGSLGAVPGGFDSHTPLPLHEAWCDVCVFLPMVLQILQDYASLFGLQNYASPSLCIKIHSRNLRFSSHT